MPIFVCTAALPPRATVHLLQFVTCYSLLSYFSFGFRDQAAPHKHQQEQGLSKAPVGCLAEALAGKPHPRRLQSRRPRLRCVLYAKLCHLLFGTFRTPFRGYCCSSTGSTTTLPRALYTQVTLPAAYLLLSLRLLLNWAESGHQAP